MNWLHALISFDDKDECSEDTCPLQWTLARASEVCSLQCVVSSAQYEVCKLFSEMCPVLGPSYKYVMSENDFLTNPELFSGMKQAIWGKN